MTNPRTGIASLTARQLIASGSTYGRVYVEAEPGSGKTTVSALRFGLHRFAPTADRRAVVAVSFTRSATEELRDRVIRHWGPSSVTWPHRIVTLDSLLCDLLFHLLQTGVLQWPGGHRNLEVLDTWRTALPTKSGRIRPVLRVNNRQVVIRTVDDHRPSSNPTIPHFRTAVSEGRCTHDNVREVLREALAIGEARAAMTSYFATTIRSLTVDEVFDANDLDREVFSLAASGCEALTLVGDPWQALYQFRGARPSAMTAYINQNSFSTHRLDESFRWGSDQQAWLTRQLRRRRPVQLGRGTPQEADVVLALTWQTLWNADRRILPLAIKTRAGQVQEAICTLLLNEITQQALGSQAVFLHDALTTLGLQKEHLTTDLRPDLQEAISQLNSGGPLQDFWRNLSARLAGLIPAITAQSDLPPPLRALDHLRRRTADSHLVPGLTSHQAKGREWNTVAIKLRASDDLALTLGLDPNEADHRALYVALTRARLKTLGVA